MKAKYCGTWLGLLVCVLVGTGSARAETPPIHVHGILDVTLARHGRAAQSNVLTRKDSPFDAYGARLFFDSQVNDHVQVFTQLVLRDASGLYVDGAYALYTPTPERDLHLMAGKIPWPIGTWAPRTYSNKNPLVGEPLMYQYHTSLLWFSLPSGPDQVLNWAGTTQFVGGTYAMPNGMPVIDNSYWDVGAIVTGSQRPFEYAFGATSGTPGWGDTGLDENSGKTVLGRLGLVPAPFLRAGVSAAYGPYLNDQLNSLLPPGKTADDYHQRLVMSDLQLEVSRATVIAEGFVNRWESPVAGDLDVLGGYVEAKVGLLPGSYAAARWNALRFGDITNSGGEAHTWDRDVDRLEAGVGYRIDRGTLVKAVWQRNTLRARDGVDAVDYELVGAQLSIQF